ETKTPVATSEQEKKIKGLITQLGADDWSKRDKAQKELVVIGEKLIEEYRNVKLEIRHLKTEERSKKQEVRDRLKAEIEKFAGILYTGTQYKDAEIKMWAGQICQQFQSLPQARVIFSSDNDIDLIDLDMERHESITVGEAKDILPAWSPDGTKIAFTTNRDGNDEIYVMDPDGKNFERLTEHPALDLGAAFSPDGKKIAFHSNRDGNKEIYVMDTNGKNIRRLTEHAADDMFPAWCPDGTKIAFQSNRDGEHEIYVMSADGKDLSRLTHNKAYDGTPKWHPDGTKIVFASHRDGNREIYVMDADGKNSQRMTENLGGDDVPQYNSDGDKIIFTANRGANAYTIYIMDADGKNQRKLMSYHNHNHLTPAWDPATVDLEEIASIFRHPKAERFHTRYSSVEVNKLFQQLDSDDWEIREITEKQLAGYGEYLIEQYWINKAGKKDKELKDLKNEIEQLSAKLSGACKDLNLEIKIRARRIRETLYYCTQPRIVFASDLGKDNWEIYIMNLNGTNRRRLTDSLSSDQTPVFSPDGTKIAFVSERDSNREIYVIDAFGNGTSGTETNLIRLTKNTLPDEDPDWSPDGTKLIASTYGYVPQVKNYNYEILVVDLDLKAEPPIKNVNNLSRHQATDKVPRWSPDGTKIAFESWRDGNSEIYVMSVDGSDQKRLTENQAKDSRPVWSPDGTKIAFASERDGNGEIYVMNADGSNQQRLTQDEAMDTAPSWTPDGNKIIFLSDRDDEWGTYTMGLDGTNPQRLSPADAKDWDCRCGPAFLPELSGLFAPLEIK
ncbi:MAG: DPP IV N-terminal domain-containing protein, partial [Planctomycetota bacterium]